MGIHCEIRLFKPMDGVYKPGTTVSGSIKYAVDNVTEFTRMTVSLKGFALFQINETRIVGGTTPVRIPITHLGYEIIVDNDIVVKDHNFTVDIGSEETHFNFKLPANIPPTFKFAKGQLNKIIWSKMFYYVRIKFGRPRLLEAKSFKKEIPVGSGITPVLPREPTIYREKKTLTNIFSCKTRVVNLKAVIQDCVIKRGGTVNFNCEVENLTNIKIKALEIGLLEVHTFMKDKYATDVVEYVNRTEFKTGSIKAGDKQTFDFVIDVPSDRVSLEHSQIIFRKYFVEILAKLPTPHRNLPLRIPLQIGDILESEMHLVPTLIASDVDLKTGGVSSSEDPLTYWESMKEHKADMFSFLTEEFNIHYNDYFLRKVSKHLPYSCSLMM